MKIAYGILGFLAILGFIVIVPERPTYLPEELNGVWISAHPDYIDRTLDLSEITMVFSTSDETVDVYFVDKVEETLQGNRTLYTVNFHRYDKEEGTAVFYYSKENEKTIRFKNQPNIIWKKRKRS